MGWLARAHGGATVAIIMAGTRWHCLYAVALLLWLALGLPPHGIGADAAAVASVGLSMTLDCDSCDAPGDDASCPPTWCVLCPALVPAGPAILDGTGTAVPVPADERGRGLSLRPRPPPPRFLRRA
jgi:hypothetical protein